MILILVLYMLLGLAFTISKAALEYAAPVFLVGIRMSLAGVLLLGYMYFFNRRNWYFNKRDIWLLVQISFLSIYLSFILEFWGLQYISSSKDCFLFNLSPFVTALLEWRFFGVCMTIKKWLGLLIGFVGFFPILLKETPLEEMAGSFLFISLPELAILGSAISAVYAWILIKGLIQKERYSPEMINGITMLWGGIAALITSWLVEKQPVLKFPPHATEISWAHLPFIGYIFGDLGAKIVPLAFYILSLILLANVIFYNFYIYLLKKHSATFLSFVGFSAPLFAAFFGWLFLNEPISWAFFISVFVVGFGLYIFYQDELLSIQK
ncbi:DMT family transporter [Candidatus Dependentiae bacterium]|nr:MAG: DMT family transporter [Candidatus Dependentiae bacterium]